jgi:hypothetical protein
VPTKNQHPEGAQGSRQAPRQKIKEASRFKLCGSEPQLRRFGNTV